MSYRFVILVDVPGDSLEGAYKNLLTAMEPVKGIEGWESTDEVYDNDGDLVDESLVNKATLKVLHDEYPSSL